MLQAPIFDSLSFYPFALLDDGLHPAEVALLGINILLNICNYLQLYWQIKIANMYFAASFFHM